MIKIENIEVFNLEGAFRGLRNPMDSWDKSDSYKDGDRFVIGPKDLNLACRMIDAGAPNDKFMRQILVSMDITAPLYWQTFCQKTLFRFISGVTLVANGEA